jgi:hypothetical protein
MSSDEKLDENVVQEYCAYIRHFLSLKDGKRPSMFNLALINTLFIASVADQRKITSVYPELGEAFERYLSGKLCAENCHCED